MSLFQNKSINSYAKIGKEFLVRCTSLVENHKQINKEVHVNLSFCKCLPSGSLQGKECPRYVACKSVAEKQVQNTTFLNTNRKMSFNDQIEYLALEEIKNSCGASNHACPFGCVSVIETTKYINEANQYNVTHIPSFSAIRNIERVSPEISEALSSEWKTIEDQLTKPLSAIQIKVALLYHFLCDNKGFVRSSKNGVEYIYTSENELAEILNCNTKSIRKANEVLCKRDYISYSKLGSGNISVCITNYSRYHLPEKKGGKGYLVMSDLLLKQLIECKNVNTLKLALRMMLLDDKANIKSDNYKLERKYTSFDLSDAWKYIPKYIVASSSFNSMLESLNTIFDIQTVDGKLQFKLIDEFVGKRYRDAVCMEDINIGKQLFEKEGFSLSNEDAADVGQLVNQYGKENVKEGIASIKSHLDRQFNEQRKSLLDVLSSYAQLEKETDEEAFFYSAIKEEIKGVLYRTIAFNETTYLKVEYPHLAFCSYSDIENIGGYLRNTIVDLQRKKLKSA